jgi:hypothetical protein
MRKHSRPLGTLWAATSVWIQRHYLAKTKKLAKILVELDIHEGLLESLDIDWRGYLTRQKLDYLGIPFHCTLCRQTCHLRKTCTGAPEDELSKDAMLELSSNLDSPVLGSQINIADYPEDSALPGQVTLTGKLKLICPTFYFSLTSWEKNLLDNSPPTSSGPIPLPRGDPSSELSSIPSFHPPSNLTHHHSTPNLSTLPNSSVPAPPMITSGTSTNLFPSTSPSTVKPSTQTSPFSPHKQARNATGTAPTTPHLSLHIIGTSSNNVRTFINSSYNHHINF